MALTKAKLEELISSREIQLSETSADYTIADSLGVKRYDNSVDALANVATDGNAAILQPYLTAGHSIRFLDGFYAFEDELIIGASLKLAGHDRNKCRLLFPGSRGLVYGTAEYDAYNNVTGLSIMANGHCIDFINDGVTFPYNVYWSRFNDLVLNSTTGHCVYAGNNLGKSGDIMVFSTHFSDIIVTAPAGAGFYGLDGLDITFERISDAIDIINVFQNCSGTFRDINTSFAAAERFLYIDGNNRPNYSMKISLENVNIEAVTKQAISVVSSTVAVSHLSMKNVKFELPYGTTNSTEYPFYFSFLYATSIYGLHLPGWPTHYNTATVKAPFRVFVDTYPASISSDDYQYYCDTLTSVLRFRPQYFVPVPASGSAPGNLGQYSADANYIYFCYAQDTWVRCAITAW